MSDVSNMTSDDVRQFLSNICVKTKQITVKDTNDEGEIIYKSINVCNMDITYDEFEDIVINAIRQTLDAKQYVYGSIQIIDDVSHDYTTPQTDRICTIKFPDQSLDGPSGIKLYMKRAYDDLIVYDFTDHDDLMDVLTKNIMHMTEAYNNAYIATLRVQKYTREISNNIADKEYVFRNILPEISDINVLLKQQETNLFTHPFVINKGLVYTFIVSDNSHNMACKLTKSEFDALNVDVNDMLQHAIVNLNNRIMKTFQIKSITERLVDSTIGEDAPTFIVDALTQKLQDDYSIMNNSLYVAEFRNTPANAGAIALSRTAMLTIAKRIGAKKKIQIIPSSIHELIVKNGDSHTNDSEIEIDDEIVKIVNNDQLTLQKTLSDCVWNYNVITGEIT